MQSVVGQPIPLGNNTLQGDLLISPDGSKSMPWQSMRVPAYWG